MPDDKTTTTQDDPSTKNTVSAEELEKTASELKKERTTKKDLEAKLAEKERELENYRKSQDEEKGNYKSLYEQATAKNKEWETKYSKLKENVVYNEKFKAAQTKLVESGLRKDALSILEKEALDDIVVEHTSEGRMLVNGVDEFVDSFKKKYGFAFEAKKPPTVNGGGGSGGSTDDEPIDGAALYALERKHGVKSKEYQAALTRFREQRMKRK